MFGKGLIALTLAAVAIAQSLTINSVASLIECQPALISWSGGTGPYYIAAIPGGQTSAAALKDFGQQSGTSLTWKVDLPAGTSVGFRVTDSTGNINYNQAVTIQAGSTDCLNSASGSASVSAASGAASASGSAASAAASSAVVSSSAAAVTSAAASRSATSAASAAASGASSATSAARSGASSAGVAASSAAASAAPSSGAMAFAAADIKVGAVAVLLGAAGLLL